MGTVKITIQQFEDFERQFLFIKINNPYYRLGQAFYNTFTEISTAMEADGDLGSRAANRLWNSTDREEVLELIDWYIIR
jgi:hypothetical protein